MRVPETRRIAPTTSMITSAVPRSGSDEYEAGEAERDQTHGLHELREGARRRAAGEIRGDPDDECELRELGRLERERPDVDPATRSVDATPDRENADAEDGGADEKGRRDRAELLQREPREHEQGDEADEGEERLPLDVPLRVSMPQHGRPGRGAVDHDEAEEHERGRDEDDEVPLELERLRPSHDRSLSAPPPAEPGVSAL